MSPGAGPHSPRRSKLSAGSEREPAVSVIVREYMYMADQKKPVLIIPGERWNISRFEGELAEGSICGTWPSVGSGRPGPGAGATRRSATTRRSKLSAGSEREP